MDIFLQSLLDSISPGILFLTVLGTLLGIVIGALPGLSSTMGVALAIPLTFGMPPLAGLAMLGGIYCGSVYGGSISAILLNTPGTDAAAATVLDGYPMTKQGKAVEALGYATIASFVGGVLSVGVLAVAAPLLAKVALKFGPAEYFGVMLLGIAIISSIAGDNFLKGLLAGTIGLFVGTIGFDPMLGFPRFAEGISGLYGGFGIIPALIGLFTISQALIIISESQRLDKLGGLQGRLPKLKDLKGSFTNLFRSSTIGTIIGILPGVGTSIAAFLSYNEAKRFSKQKETFGKGNPEGLMAAESANNAVTGGSLVPLLTLGIPGNAVTAVFLGALTIQGLRPGPFLFDEQASLMYGLFISLIIANICFLVFGLLGVRIFPKVLKVPPYLMAAVIMAFGTVGAFAVQNEFFDVWAVLLFGILGYLFILVGIPAAPIVLGIILGPLIETNYKQALLLSDGNHAIFYTSPISLALIIIALISFLIPFFRQLTTKKS